MSSYKLYLSLAILGFFASNVQSQTCPANYCGANGVCVIKNGVPTCNCNPGYVGTRCTLLDPCFVKPCGGSGACYQIVRPDSLGVEQVSFYCQCYTGFTGDRCQIAGPNACEPNPCFNNGKCSVKPNLVEYLCNCPIPYTGPRCGTYVNYCLDNKCENGAKCIQTTTFNIQTNSYYTCSCTSGFAGAFCEAEQDKCKSDPCKNGAVCLNLIDGYLCKCPAGFTGTNCETVFRPCDSNPCGPNAICTEGAGATFSCACNNGFLGTPPNCYPNPCKPGTCKKPDSTCIPSSGFSINIGGTILNGNWQCSGNIPGSAYACVCKATIPFVSADC